MNESFMNLIFLRFFVCFLLITTYHIEFTNSNVLYIVNCLVGDAVDDDERIKR